MHDAEVAARTFAAGDISIVVPVGGKALAWERAARSLSRLEPPPGEIVVVIDGRNDAAAATAALLGGAVLTLERCGGPARARNRGAKAAREAVVLFLDADVEAQPGLVAEVARFFNAQEDVDAMFGSYDAEPADPSLVSQYRNLLHHFVHQAGRAEASTFWAGCGAVRRSAFEAVGGFDEQWREPSIEDIELGTRLVRAGCAVRLAKHIQVKHLKAWRLRDLIVTDLWRRAVPWTELMLRDRRMVNDLNVRTRDRVSVVAVFVALGGLAAGLVVPAAAIVAALSLAVLLALNASFLSYLVRHRGLWFAAQSVPLYCLYLLICGIGFGIGLVRHLAGRGSRRYRFN
jgi:GT2 family glycosyltransferase